MPVRRWNPSYNSSSTTRHTHPIIQLVIQLVMHRVWLVLLQSLEVDSWKVEGWTLKVPCILLSPHCNHHSVAVTSTVLLWVYIAHCGYTSPMGIHRPERIVVLVFEFSPGWKIRTWVTQGSHAHAMSVRHVNGLHGIQSPGIVNSSKS